MEIRELATKTGISAKTIRYYESVGVLPPPKRLPNDYRDYREADVERVNFVAGLRRLDFSLDDIREIVAMRDRREAPCRMILDTMSQKEREISLRIAELSRLAAELRQLHALGLTFPTNDVDGKNCVCHLVTEKT
jgi:DNA-binding transcriptional MerR regulator